MTEKSYVHELSLKDMSFFRHMAICWTKSYTHKLVEGLVGAETAEGQVEALADIAEKSRTHAYFHTELLDLLRQCTQAGHKEAVLITDDLTHTFLVTVTNFAPFDPAAPKAPEIAKAFGEMDIEDYGAMIMRIRTKISEAPLQEIADEVEDDFVFTGKVPNADLPN